MSTVAPALDTLGDDVDDAATVEHAAPS